MADLVLLYSTDAPHKEQRLKCFSQMAKAGLRVRELPTRSGKRMLVLITAMSQARLEDEAEMRCVSMKLAPTASDVPGAPIQAVDFKKKARGKFLLKKILVGTPLAVLAVVK